jgi:hypothetical protein
MWNETTKVIPVKTATNETISYPFRNGLSNTMGNTKS